MSRPSAMTSSHSGKSETEDPTSYQHMEQVLSKVAARKGEDTREAQEAHSLPKSKENEIQDEIHESKKLLNSELESSFNDPEDHISKTKGTSSNHEEPNILHNEENQDVSNASKEEPGKKLATPSEVGAGVFRSASSEAKSGGKKKAASPSQERGSEPGIVEDEQQAPSQVTSTHVSHAPLESFINHSSRVAPAFMEDSLSQAKFSGPPRIIHAEIAENYLASHSPDSSISSPTNLPGVPDSSSKSKPGASLRRGKWTVEEEAYVARVIQDFNSGFLNAPAGTTLRSYLSDKLQCDPMRITKKFTGDACIGKRVFHPAVRSAANAATIDKAQAELDTLERRWRRRLDMQQRESAKKAAASAAATNVSSLGGRDHGLIHGVPVALLGGAVPQGTVASGGPPVRQNGVTQAASWLDRANAILKGTKAEGSAATPNSHSSGLQQLGGQSFDSMPNAEIENQMKEVQRLIYEGPLIQQTTAGLPTFLAHNEEDPSNLNATSQGVAPTADPSLPAEPADKRKRRSSHSGAEDADAAALVGFLRSVRAAAGQEYSS